MVWETFNNNCAVGIEPIEENIDNYLNQSLMLVTALNPHIGYEAAQIAKKAHKEGLTLNNLQFKLDMLQKNNLKHGLNERQWQILIN